MSEDLTVEQWLALPIYPEPEQSSGFGRVSLRREGAKNFIAHGRVYELYEEGGALFRREVF